LGRIGASGRRFIGKSEESGDLVIERRNPEEPGYRDIGISGKEPNLAITNIVPPWLLEALF
jgi:hypothetical protein